MLTLEKAMILAIEAHSEQFDKGGKPYILHPLHVMSCMDTESEMIVAVLHDVVEDSTWTLEGLQRELELPRELIHAIDLLTRKPDQMYSLMIEGVKLDPIAKKVKLADLEHNMDVRRIIGRCDMSKRDKDRIAKYLKAWSYLKGE